MKLKGYVKVYRATVLATIHLLEAQKHTEEMAFKEWLEKRLSEVATIKNIFRKPKYKTRDEALAFIKYRGWYDGVPENDPYRHFQDRIIELERRINFFKPLIAVTGEVWYYVNQEAARVIYTMTVDEKDG